MKQQEQILSLIILSCAPNPPYQAVTISVRNMSKFLSVMAQK
ncbi:hypothetical protein [Anabaena catenula]|nr:hypothetical protein [Anabaena catenula]